MALWFPLSQLANCVCYCGRVRVCVLVGEARRGRTPRSPGAGRRLHGAVPGGDGRPECGQDDDRTGQQTAWDVSDGLQAPARTHGRAYPREIWEGRAHRRWISKALSVLVSKNKSGNTAPNIYHYLCCRKTDVISNCDFLLNGFIQFGDINTHVNSDFLLFLCTCAEDIFLIILHNFTSVFYCTCTCIRAHNQL